MPASDSYLSQLRSKGGWKSSSKRWTGPGSGDYGPSLNQINGLKNMCGDENGRSLFVVKKRVMVIVDQSSHSKHAMVWALTHVANMGDILTLLHIVSPSECHKGPHDFSPQSLATSLGSLCKACKPEVEVEALVIQGPKMATVMSQVKKLEVSVLVLGQKKVSPILSCLFVRSSTDEFVEECINSLECLTIGVRKQSNGVSGYLITTKWHKNFWLLA
ncbi:Adenine nucleotide alpha hydrolases-like superfamily protein [Striga hermonthica]|uniref:Adenine nucleotide alpha hydrolases-like superfamily protein n=1 Tax=Striga hermonthica TaxID=68872 RepID=A0A9N7R3Q2_STRHE|nr:Adenine nucleotide alpha hydrolases-like superfamily protein [Striga hermonthica]